MKNYLITRAALLPLAVALLASGTHAATISFNGAVTTIPGLIPAGAVFPTVGTAATVNLDIDDSDPTALLFDMGSHFQNMTASADVPGFLSGSMSVVSQPNYQPAPQSIRLDERTPCRQLVCTGSDISENAFRRARLWPGLRWH